MPIKQKSYNGRETWVERMVVTFDDVACYSLYVFDRVNKEICQEK